MTPTDLRILCAALGFTVTIMREGGATGDDAHRALGVAGLIEEFCRANMVCTFEADGDESEGDNSAPAIWSCVHGDGHSNIVDANSRQLVATIWAAPGSEAALIAKRIVRAVNGHGEDIDLIAEMGIALDLCLKCDGQLTWSTEHDAQIVLDRAKHRIEGDRYATVS